VVSEKLLLQVKRQMECTQIVALSRFARKRRGYLLKRVAREPAARESAQKGRADGLTVDQYPDSGELGFQSGDGGGGLLSRDQPPTEVRTDCCVAVPAPCELLGTTLGEARIVEHASTFECSDRFLPRRTGVPRPGQTSLELTA
jgi:hypothetical protein